MECQVFRETGNGPGRRQHAHLDIACRLSSSSMRLRASRSSSRAALSPRRRRLLAAKPAVSSTTSTTALPALANAGSKRNCHVLKATKPPVQTRRTLARKSATPTTGLTRGSMTISSSADTRKASNSSQGASDGRLSRVLLRMFSAPGPGSPPRPCVSLRVSTRHQPGREP